MSEELKKAAPEKVVKVVNELGLEKAALRFGRSPSTLSRYLRGLGYRIRRQYVRQEVPLSQN